MIAIPNIRLNALTLKLIIGVCCLALLALLIHDRNRWKAKTAHYSEMLAAERVAHAGTIANYRTAAEQARQADLAYAERVRARWRKVAVTAGPMLAPVSNSSAAIASERSATSSNFGRSQ